MYDCQDRLTAEYEETQHKCKGYQRYLFEEMLVTRNQIEAGVNEQQHMVHLEGGAEHTAI